MQLRYLGHGDSIVPMELLDKINSLVWTERYQSPGDFELILDITNEINERVVLDIIDSLESFGENGGQDCYFDIYEDWRYVENEKLKIVMLVETIELVDDIESGALVKIKGRSLGSLLDRRLVWGQKVFDNKQIMLVLDDLLTPAFSGPRLMGIIETHPFFEKNEILLSQTNKLTGQWTGDPLDEVIQSICKMYDIGYEVLWKGNRTYGENINGSPCRIVFYSGKNRTNRQNSRKPVIFSTQLDNLLSSDYLKSLREFKNVALVAGEDTGSNRKLLEVFKNIGNPDIMKSNRRELFVDARDIQMEKEDGTTYTNEEYAQLLRQRGLEKLSEHPIITAMEAGIDAKDPKFVYGKDYFIGDKVTIITNFGLEISAIVSEVVRTLDETGYSINPTFELI